MTIAHEYLGVAEQNGGDQTPRGVPQPTRWNLRGLTALPGAVREPNQELNAIGGKCKRDVSARQPPSGSRRAVVSVLSEPRVRRRLNGGQELVA